MKEDARKMVLTMVDMERSYLTADVFRDIISQNGAVDGAEQPGLLRTLSGLPSVVNLNLPAKVKLACTLLTRYSSRHTIKGLALSCPLPSQ